MESGEGDVPRRVPVFACVSLVSLHGGLPCEDNVVEIAKGRDGEFKTGEESSEHSQAIRERYRLGQLKLDIGPLRRPEAEDERFRRKPLPVLIAVEYAKAFPFFPQALFHQLFEPWLETAPLCGDRQRHLVFSCPGTFGHDSSKLNERVGSGKRAPRLFAHRPTQSIKILRALKHGAKQRAVRSAVGVLVHRFRQKTEGRRTNENACRGRAHASRCPVLTIQLDRDPSAIPGLCKEVQIGTG